MNMNPIKVKTSNRQLFWWLGSLVLGTVAGLLHVATYYKIRKQLEG